MKNTILLVSHIFLLASCAFGAYQPDGEAFVCVNGTNRFTRALYGSCAASRVETSDIPEASLYLSGREAYTVEFPELAQFASIVARYEKGVRRYELTDRARIGNGRLEVTITALAEGDGGVIKVEGRGLEKPYALHYIEGRMRAKKLFRDGDYGRDPSSAFFVNDKGRRDVKSIELRNDAPIYLALEKKEKGQESKLRVEVEERNDSTLGLGLKTSTHQLSTLFAAGVVAAAKVANHLVIKTPDPHVNALGPALALAENGAWDDKLGVYMHGAIGWRMPLNGWRGAYLADLLGDHARARTHFGNYLASMVTNVPCKLAARQDGKRGHARAEEQWGTPMYSNGYICREPRNAKKMHHYDMNLIFIDELFWHLRSTGDREYARQVWPKIKLHLAWEKRVFDADNDHLYDGYCCIWASDALQYNGGAVTHASAYNCFHNRLAAEVAEWIGEDSAPYRAEAAAIAKAMDERLWIDDKGYWAEFVDNMGRKMRHDAAAAWSEYTPIDCEIGTPEQRYSAAKYMEHMIPHHAVNGEYAVISTTNWQPYRWSINNVAMAEIMHAALAHWLAGNDAEAWRLYKGIIFDSCYQGCGPGNFEQLSKLDGRTGECYRDFTDTTACALRATIRGLFGISPDLIHGVVHVSPGFPASWDFAELHTADIDFVFRREGTNEVYDIKAHYPVPAKVVVEKKKVKSKSEKVKNADDSRISDLRYKALSYSSIDISQFYNDRASSLYANGKYVSPAWPYTTLKLPSSGLGDWCVPNAKAHKNNHEGDMKRTKSQETQEAGFTIDCDDPVAFTSLYDNYPTKIEFPISGCGSVLKLELVASTYHMQYGVTNGTVTANYADGTSTVFALILPETLAPANVRLVDTWQMPCATADRERPSLGNGWADVEYMALDPKKELKSLALETWSNETVIGLKSLALGKEPTTK